MRPPVIVVCALFPCLPQRSRGQRNSGNSAVQPLQCSRMARNAVTHRRHSPYKHQTSGQMPSHWSQSRRLVFSWRARCVVRSCRVPGSIDRSLSTRGEAGCGAHSGAAKEHRCPPRAGWSSSSGKEETGRPITRGGTARGTDGAWPADRGDKSGSARTSSKRSCQRQAQAVKRYGRQKRRGETRRDTQDT